MYSGTSLARHSPDQKKCRRKRSVAVTGVGETYACKKLYFYEFKTILNFNFSCIFKQ